MKTVFLLRHAKSSWDEPGLRDQDRPLNRRGRKSAKAMGQYLAEHKLFPQRILCSTAVRTRQTLERISPYLPRQTVAEFESALYLSTPETMLDLIRCAPKGIDRLMVIAHNPGTEELARMLIGADDEDLDAGKAGGDAASIARLRQKFPTAALAVIEIQQDKWKSVGGGKGILKRFVLPKDLIPD